MALIDDVKNVCARLAPHGWKELLAQHGLDITAPDLAAELNKKLTNIKRGLSGFEDFALEGERGVEPGHPARSLLYHTLASPNVLVGAGGAPLDEFPTPAELDAVENYVFGARTPSLEELRKRAENAGSTELAVVVFSKEYRPATHTCHEKHADLVFSRTAVARVGTAPPLYDARRRGFLPFVEGKPHAMRVLPSRFAVYIAARVSGSQLNFCPMRFRLAGQAEDQVSDQNRKFWQPLHKLFPGPECLRDFPNLQVTLSARHVNEKLRRIHLHLLDRNFDTGVNPENLSQPPFIFTAGIAELSASPEQGTGLLVPVAHARLVEPAEFGGKPLSFIVPPGLSLFASSLELRVGSPNSPPRERPVPEYVHIRTRVEPDGTLTDLNERRDMMSLLAAGNYHALHYVDFTGDGCVEAACPPLTGPGGALPGALAAYSLVTAPDFFPTCDQRELMKWVEGLNDSEFLTGIWMRQPVTLSDQRLAANVQLPQSPFDKSDRTMTAIVSMFGEVSKRQTNAQPADALRHSSLPDDSAGIFAPGWDISRDRLPDGTPHFAAYGLGSPFPEDAKLCAALSTFWPAAAPDSTRAMEPISSFTVSPLTDEEIGSVGSLPWDGIPGPRVLDGSGPPVAEYASFDHADYVRSALDARFTLALTTHIGVEEYQDRVTVMTVVYRALQSALGLARDRWLVLSFRATTPGEQELVNAQAQAQTTLPGKVYRFELFQRGTFTTPQSDFRKRRVRITNRCVVFAQPDRANPGASVVLLKRGNANFRRV